MNNDFNQLDDFDKIHNGNEYILVFYINELFLLNNIFDNDIYKKYKYYYDFYLYDIFNLLIKIIKSGKKYIFKYDKNIDSNIDYNDYYNNYSNSIYFYVFND